MENLPFLETSVLNCQWQTWDILYKMKYEEEGYLNNSYS